MRAPDSRTKSAALLHVGLDCLSGSMPEPIHRKTGPSCMEVSLLLQAMRLKGVMNCFCSADERFVFRMGESLFDSGLTSSPAHLLVGFQGFGIANCVDVLLRVLKYIELDPKLVVHSPKNAVQMLGCLLERTQHKAPIIWFELLVEFGVGPETLPGSDVRPAADEGRNSVLRGT
jgi:hypothetical protein